MVVTRGDSVKKRSVAVLFFPVTRRPSQEAWIYQYTTTRRLENIPEMPRSGGYWDGITTPLASRYWTAYRINEEWDSKNVSLERVSRVSRCRAWEHLRTWPLWKYCVHEAYFASTWPKWPDIWKSFAPLCTEVMPSTDYHHLDASWHTKSLSRTWMYGSLKSCHLPYICICPICNCSHPNNPCTPSP